MRLCNEKIVQQCSEIDPDFKLRQHFKTNMYLCSYFIVDVHTIKYLPERARSFCLDKYPGVGVSDNDS